MTLTTYTNRTLAAAFTQQQLYDEIKAAMQVAGFSAPIDENGSAGSTMEQIYSYTFNASTKGTVFFRIQIPAGAGPAVTQTLFDTYNTAANTGTNASTSPLSLTVTNAGVLSVLTINNPEMRGICLRADTTDLGFIGLIRPETKPPEWDENQWPYAFIFGTNGTSLKSCAAASQPNINQSTVSYFGPNFGPNSLTVINTLTGQSDLFPWGNLIVNAASNIPHYGGRFSDHIASVQGTGRSQGDTFNSQWIYMGKSICSRYAT